MRTGIRNTAGRLLAPALTLVVLGGLVAEQLSYAAPEDADAYHQQVREAVERIPYEIGDWSGTDVDVPPAAVKLLDPNALCSRRYENPKTHQSVNLLIVHCRDARDMGGHYPPVCYPAHGWVLRQTREVLWEVNPRMLVPAAEYEFSMWLPSRSRTTWVVNVLVLPDGTMTRDMSPVRSAAADYRTHFFGAGQIQLAFGERIRASERERIFKTFISAIEPVIEAIRRGVEE